MYRHTIFFKWWTWQKISTVYKFNTFWPIRLECSAALWFGVGSQTRFRPDRITLYKLCKSSTFSIFPFDLCSVSHNLHHMNTDLEWQHLKFLDSAHGNEKNVWKSDFTTRWKRARDKQKTDKQKRTSPGWKTFNFMPFKQNPFFLFYSAFAAISSLAVSQSITASVQPWHWTESWGVMWRETLHWDQSTYKSSSTNDMKMSV